MTPRYPGAVWLPTGDNGPMPHGPDAGSLHEAVSRTKSIFGWVQSAKACHAYNAQNGYFEQYMDWDRIAYGVSAGNGHVITIESFDGLLIHLNPYREEGMGGIYGTSADTGRWDPGQCERASDVIAWLNTTLGISMALSTTAGHPGWNGHRIGIEPWRSDIYHHGESWTNHNGKPCPGNLRMAQIPGILARAKVIKSAVAAGAKWLPPGEVNLSAALARGGGAAPPDQPPNQPPPVQEEDMTPYSEEQMKEFAKVGAQRFAATQEFRDRVMQAVNESLTRNAGAATAQAKTGSQQFAATQEFHDRVMVACRDA